jgi:hypothetical protein
MAIMDARSPRLFLGRVFGRLSPSPDIGTTPRIMAVAAFVGLVSVVLTAKFGMTDRLGDTDDAMRLVMVRDLLAGQGWYDQLITRLQPPQGLYMHWSRLLDGALAGVISLLRLFVSPARAEWITRFAWPLAWIFPAVASALMIARNLGGRAAVFLTAPLLVLDDQLFRQFHPGRVDHHNVQIVMTVAALACALARHQRARWAAVAGVATALGLAIGIEALPIHALIGASYGLALARDRKAAPAAAAYGLALAVASLGFFAVQTPPWRWSLSFCDALGVNLAAALAVAGVGLALTASIAGRAPAWARITLVGLAGALAGATYLGLDPACIHGPFAAVPQAVRPFWFDRVQEMQPLSKVLKSERAPAIVAVVMTVMALASGAYLLARSWKTIPTGVVLIAACLAVAAVTGWFAWRLQDYVFWIGIPALGAALSLIAQRWLRDLMIPSFVLALVLAPSLVGEAAEAAVTAISRPAKGHAAQQRAIGRCYAPAAYRPLAALPPGLVLSETDLGSFILAFTRDSAVSAPYHRMSGSIIAAHAALDAPPAQAEARVRGLHATYVVDCPPYPMIVSTGSFGDRLRKGDTPAWLELLSKPGAVLRIFRVRPAI